MRVSKLTDEALIDQIAVVFRTHGYASASLSHLSKATGLERASLYHRFPGGKDEMAVAVIHRVGKSLSGQVETILASAEKPSVRVGRAMKVLDDFYEHGRMPCVLEALSLEGAGEKVLKPLSILTASVLEGLAAMSRDLGVKSAAGSRRCARRALALLQGSLVLSRTTGDPVHFRDALRDIPLILANSKENVS